MTDPKNIIVPGNLVALQLDRMPDDFGGGEYIMEIVIVEEGVEVSLKFQGIKELKDINLFANDPIILQITDISDRGWDRYNYEVSEVSDDLFTFYSMDFDLT